jgi:Ras-related protein Rab-6A
LFPGYDVTRKVSTGEGEAKAQEHGAMFIETSAKAGFNVKVLTLY